MSARTPYDGTPYELKEKFVFISPATNYLKRPKTSTQNKFVIFSKSAENPRSLTTVNKTRRKQSKNTNYSKEQLDSSISNSDKLCYTLPYDSSPVSPSKRGGQRRAKTSYKQNKLSKTKSALDQYPQNNTNNNLALTKKQQRRDQQIIEEQAHKNADDYEQQQQLTEEVEGRGEEEGEESGSPKVNDFTGTIYAVKQLSLYDELRYLLGALGKVIFMEPIEQELVHTNIYPTFIEQYCQMLTSAVKLQQTLETMVVEREQALEKAMRMRGMLLQKCMKKCYAKDYNKFIKLPVIMQKNTSMSDGAHLSDFYETEQKETPQKEEQTTNETQKSSSQSKMVRRSNLRDVIYASSEYSSYNQSTVNNYDPNTLSDHSNSTYSSDNSVYAPSPTSPMKKNIINKDVENLSNEDKKKEKEQKRGQEQEQEQETTVEEEEEEAVNEENENDEGENIQIENNKNNNMQEAEDSNSNSNPNPNIIVAPMLYPSLDDGKSQSLTTDSSPNYISESREYIETLVIKELSNNEMVYYLNVSKISQEVKKKMLDALSDVQAKTIAILEKVMQMREYFTRPFPFIYTYNGNSSTNNNNNDNNKGKAGIQASYLLKLLKFDGAGADDEHIFSPASQKFYSLLFENREDKTIGSLEALIGVGPLLDMVYNEINNIQSIEKEKTKLRQQKKILLTIPLPVSKYGETIDQISITEKKKNDLDEVDNQYFVETTKLTDTKNPGRTSSLRKESTGEHLLTRYSQRTTPKVSRYEAPTYTREKK